MNTYHFFAIPEAMIDDANNIAMVLGESAADGMTFGEPNATDDAGNRYLARFVWLPDTLPLALERELERPAWDVEPYVVNMAGARRAQTAVVFAELPVSAEPGSILLISGMHPDDILAQVGLTAIPEEGAVDG